jgi:hypothetical protein
MRKTALVCFLILIPSSLRAQDKKGDWKALYGLRSGEKIELVETGMEKHVGAFSTVTEEAIQLREGSTDIGIRKENVARVRNFFVKSRKDRKKEEGAKKKGDGIQTAELDRRDQVTATKSWPNFPSRKGSRGRLLASSTY